MAKIFWAFLFSALVHFALMMGARVEIPTPVEFAPLEVKLQPPPPAPPALAVKARKNPARKAAPIRVAQAPPQDIPPAPTELSDIAPVATRDEPPATAVVSEAPFPEANDFAYPDKHVEIAYRLHSSEDFTMGQVAVTYTVKSNNYTITSIGEANGLVSLFVPGKHVQVSQGKVTREGLKPESFWIERGQKADKRNSVQFDWSQQTLTYPLRNRESVSLPPNAQDFLSFLYQFSFAPPQAGQEVFVTDGRKLDRYTFALMGEENLETPVGLLATLHLAARKEGRITAELWLAKDYELLPIKIRLVDKKGDTLTQVATSIIPFPNQK